MNDLGKTGILVLELMNGSISLAILHSFIRVKIAAYTHKPSIRNRAGQLTMAYENQADDAE
jgi:hypothetical protein